MARQLIYKDFDVLLERAGERIYRARVLSSPAGEAAPTRFELPFGALELDNFLLRIGRPRRGGTRRRDHPHTAAIKEFGGHLYEALFQDELRECFTRSLIEVGGHKSGLRIRLRLSDAPELAELPWEFLYDKRRNRFLCLSRRTPLVRYLEVPDPPRPFDVLPPLRVLVVISSPSDHPRLDVEQEWHTLNEAVGGLQAAGRVALERLEAATLNALQQRLRGDDCHVLHFIGHGGYDPHRQDGVLVLEDLTGRGMEVSGEDLSWLLNDHDAMRLVVLNACEGARVDVTDPFAGTAQSLIQQGLPAVVAMQFEITDEAAITFSRELYASVTEGYPLDAALAEARKAIHHAGNPTEWGTPVLYSRAPDGHLFDITRVNVPPSFDMPTVPTGQIASAETAPPEWPKRRDDVSPTASHPPSREAGTARQAARFHTVDEVVALALSPNGHLVAAVTKTPGNVLTLGDRAEWMTHVWDVDREQEIERLPCGALARSLGFSPDGRRLAVRGSIIGSAEVWDIRRRERLAVLKISDIRAQLNHRALAFSHDGQRIATSGEAGAIIWDVLTGGIIKRIRYEVGAFDYRTADVVAFSPDDELLAMAVHGSIKVYDLPTDSVAVDLFHEEAITALAYSPRGDRLAVAGETNAQVWELETKATRANCTTEEPLADIAFGRDGNQLTTLTVKPARGVVAQIWDLEVDAQDRRAAFSQQVDILSGRGGRTILDHRNRTRMAVLSDDGSRLALVGYDDILCIWDIGRSGGD